MLWQGAYLGAMGEYPASSLVIVLCILLFLLEGSRVYHVFLQSVKESYLYQIDVYLGNRRTC